MSRQSVSLRAQILDHVVARSPSRAGGRTARRGTRPSRPPAAPGPPAPPPRPGTAALRRASDAAECTASRRRFQPARCRSGIRCAPCLPLAPVTRRRSWSRSAGMGGGLDCTAGRWCFGSEVDYVCTVRVPHLLSVSSREVDGSVWNYHYLGSRSIGLMNYRPWEISKFQQSVSCKILASWACW